MEFQVGDFIFSKVFFLASGVRFLQAFWLLPPDCWRFSGFCHQIVIRFLGLAYSHKENPRQVGNLLQDREDFLMKPYN
jgi:hypothetical protein